MCRTLIQRLTETREDQKRLKEEEAILEVTEMICAVMERDDVSRSDLAERLGTSKSNVTQLLAGRRNMTVRLIADVLFALEMELRVEAVPLGAVKSSCVGSLTVWQVGSSAPAGFKPKAPATRIRESASKLQPSEMAVSDVAA